MLSSTTGSVWSKGVKSFLQPKRGAESETRSQGGDGMLLHTHFFLTANTSAQTLILHGHTHKGLSSRENPHSTVALQKLINVPIRGISRFAFHYKAGISRGEMGTISLMAALGSWDKVQTQHTAQTCPSPASHNPSCIGLVNPLLNPTLPLTAPQEPQRCSRKHRAPASLVFAGFPLNSQPCSAHGIQRRDQGSRFHLIHPQNHHARGKKTHHFQGFSGHFKLAGCQQKHPR